MTASRWTSIVLLGLCGCPSSSSHGEVADTSDAPAETTESDAEGGLDAPTGTGRPVLSSPAEADDLDPDPDVVRVELIAAPLSYTVGGELVDGWAYNQQVPGPTIRLRRGDTLVVDFHNALPDETTVHWHGLHVPFEMDGVTWQGQAVEPGADFTYTFTVEQAGTYWYHPHVDSARQADLGLYGAIVVEDPAEPAVDRELVAVFDSWGEHLSGAEHDGLGSAALEWTVNGLVDPVYPVEAGERVRVRAVNVSNTGYLDLAWPEIRQIGSDQGLLPQAVSPPSIVLAPSDRADAMILVDSTVEITARPHSLVGAPTVGEPTALFEIGVAQSGASPEPLVWPFDGAAPTPDPGFTDVLYAFHGDPVTGKWTINGELFPDVTIESVAIDAWVVVELRNISQTAHPFHLHGHAFEVLTIDGEPPAYQTIEDSIDVAPYSIVRLGFVADNPGDWMAHCHILPHVEGGMMTVLRVGAEP